MFRFASEPTSVNFTNDKGLRISYVNKPGSGSSTTEKLFPPATADSSLEKKKSYLANITLNNNTKDDLLRLIKNLEIFNGTFFLKQAPQVAPYTDAILTS